MSEPTTPKNATVPAHLTIAPRQVWTPKGAMTVPGPVADIIDGLVEALDGLLDWTLANRGTKYEFVVGRSDCLLDVSALVVARTALLAARPSVSVE